MGLTKRKDSYRSGEVLNLTWDRLDLKAGLIRLRAEAMRAGWFP